MKAFFTNRCEKGSYFRVDGSYFFDRLPRNFLLKEDLPSAVQHICDAVVLIRVRDAQGLIGFGTGLVVGGAVLTALHVVKNADSIWLSYKECDIGAREIARDKNLDFALLEPLSLREISRREKKLLSASSVVLARKWELRRGELYAVGHLSVREAREGKTSIYRKLLCAYKIKSKARRDMDQVRFAVSIPSAVRDFFGGFSGGVLVDSHGVIMGIMRGIAKVPESTLGVISFRHSSYIVGARGHKMRDFLTKASKRFDEK